MRSRNAIQRGGPRLSDAGQLPFSWLSSYQDRCDRGQPDRSVLAITYVLAMVGIIMVFSASGVMAENRYGDSMYFLKRQGLWLIGGLAMMHGAAHVDYRMWKDLSPSIVGLTGILLIAVLIPGIGVEVNGARRWFRFGGVSFQPAELAKIAVVIYLASFLSNKEARIEHFFSGFLPPVVVVGGMAALILVEPDMGTTVVLGMLLMGLLFLSGARLLHLGGLFIVLIPLALAMAFGSEYRRKRMLSFLDPWQDPSDTGFQLTQAFVALGSGKFWGVGLGESKQKLFFLPEVHSDFVLALIGEELGFFGISLLLLLFGIFILKGFQISRRASDALGSRLALGVTLLIGGQALINAGVVAGLLPTKGLTLPLVSYGGSSLMVTLLGIGILLSVSSKGVSPVRSSSWGRK